MMCKCYGPLLRTTAHQTFLQVARDTFSIHGFLGGRRVKEGKDTRPPTRDPISLRNAGRN